MGKALLITSLTLLLTFGPFSATASVQAQVPPVLPTDVTGPTSGAGVLYNLNINNSQLLPYEARRYRRTNYGGRLYERGLYGQVLYGQGMYGQSTASPYTYWGVLTSPIVVPYAEQNTFQLTQPIILI